MLRTNRHVSRNFRCQYNSTSENHTLKVLLHKSDQIANHIDRVHNQVHRVPSFFVPAILGILLLFTKNELISLDMIGFLLSGSLCLVTLYASMLWSEYISYIEYQNIVLLPKIYEFTDCNDKLNVSQYMARNWNHFASFHVFLVHTIGLNFFCGLGHHWIREQSCQEILNCMLIGFWILMSAATFGVMRSGIHTIFSYRKMKKKGAKDLEDLAL